MASRAGNLVVPGKPRVVEQLLTQGDPTVVKWNFMGNRLDRFLRQIENPRNRGFLLRQGLPKQFQIIPIPNDMEKIEGESENRERGWYYDVPFKALRFFCCFYAHICNTIYFGNGKRRTHFSLFFVCRAFLRVYSKMRVGAFFASVPALSSPGHPYQHTLAGGWEGERAGAANFRTDCYISPPVNLSATNQRESPSASIRSLKLIAYPTVGGQSGFDRAVRGAIPSGQRRPWRIERIISTTVRTWPPPAGGGDLVPRSLYSKQSAAVGIS